VTLDYCALYKYPYLLACHMASHSVTCHSAEVTFPPLPQPKLVSLLDLATPEGWKAETVKVRSPCARLYITAELFMGLFCVTRSNPTRQLTDPTQHTTSGKMWTQPDATQPNTTDNGAYSFVETHFYTQNLSCAFSQPRINLFMFFAGRFPVPVRSAVKSNLTAWCN